jgi:MarR family 2-MHQ and catechol resistance regulon transcriptional repressor
MSSWVFLFCIDPPDGVAFTNHVDERALANVNMVHTRLFTKGLVTRVESTEDRRVRIIALTPKGKELIVSAFRRHSAQMKKVFSDLTPEELDALEVALKKTGKRAAALMDQKA